MSTEQKIESDKAQTNIKELLLELAAALLLALYSYIQLLKVFQEIETLTHELIDYRIFTGIIYIALRMVIVAIGFYPIAKTAKNMIKK